jgi:hypothetical protein
MERCQGLVKHYFVGSGQRADDDERQVGGGACEDQVGG